MLRINKFIILRYEQMVSHLCYEELNYSQNYMQIRVVGMVKANKLNSALKMRLDNAQWSWPAESWHIFVTQNLKYYKLWLK